MIPEPIQRILKLQRQRRWKEALAAAEQALKSYPRHAASLLGMKALAMHHLGQTNKALELLSRYRTEVSYPDFVQAVEAELLVAAGRTAEAREIVDRLLVRGGLTDAAVRRIAAVLDAMGERERAGRVVSAWLPTASDRKAALLLLASLDDDPTWLRTLEQDYPEDDQVYAEVVRLKLRELSLEEQAEELSVLLMTSKAAQNRVLVGWAGNVLRKAGRLADAERLYRNLLAEQPANTFAQSQLAWCLAQQGRYGEAIEWLEPVVQQKPADVITRNSLMSYYRKGGEMERGRRFVEETSLRFPELRGPLWNAFRKQENVKDAR